MTKNFINSIAVQASEIAYWRLAPAKAFLNLVKLISLLATSVIILLLAMAVVAEPAKLGEFPTETWPFLALIPVFTWMLIARVDTIPKLFRFYVCLYATYGLAGVVLKAMVDPWYLFQEPLSPLVPIGFFLASWWLPLTRRDPHYIEIWRHEKNSKEASD